LASAGQVVEPPQVSATSQGPAAARQTVFAVAAACWQPAAGVQESAVQTLPSSQFAAGPPTQSPAEQVSAVVQALPSEHEDPLASAVCVQAPALQASVVHAFPSSHDVGHVVFGNPSSNVSFAPFPTSTSRAKNAPLRTAFAPIESVPFGTSMSARTWSLTPKVAAAGVAGSVGIFVYWQRFFRNERKEPDVEYRTI